MADITPYKIAVLLGGISAEREVSLISGQACAAALKTLGHNVTSIDAHPDTIKTDLKNADPDIIFNALHGDWGEDGHVQGVLEQFWAALHTFRRCGVKAGYE